MNSLYWKTATLDTEQRYRLFECLAKVHPNPGSELNYTTPFELLVAVVLSAQTTDKSVNRVTDILFPIANTPYALLALGQEQLEVLLRSIGLYRNKTRHLLRLSKQIIEHHSGEVPHSREDLEALPGVGRKTANIVLNTVFGYPTMAVDTHVYRVAQRTGLSNAKSIRDVEEELIRVTPEKFLKDAHVWLVLHGRYTCTARRPKCSVCVLSEWCEYVDKVESDDLKK